MKLLDWVVAGASMLGVATAQTDGADIPGIVQKFGALAGLVVYFLIRDQKSQKDASSREERMAKRINELEDRQHADLAEIARRSTEAIEKSADASERVARVIEHCERKTGVVRT